MLLSGNRQYKPFEVSFQGKPLLGYFWPVAKASRPCPTLIVIGGIETFAEDCYFMIGPSGRQRGYHVLTVDLPGQGTNPAQGLYFEARMERAVQVVVDEALRRPAIDADRLALFGFSWGGHIVFKAAQHDPRIKALIANPAMPNVFRAALAQQKSRNRSDPIAKLVFAQIAWRMGLKLSLNVGDLARRVAKAYDYLLHGKADPTQIRCPTLCLAGEGEAPITLQIARECFAQLPHPLKKLVIFSKAEGGEAHCQVNNLALPNRVLFDWLDAVFA
jgi:pimeloyl-ACP methyl ester carboxylesterase